MHFHKPGIMNKDKSTYKPRNIYKDKALPYDYTCKQRQNIFIWPIIVNKDKIASLDLEL